MTASVTRIIIIMTAAKAVTPIIKELSDLGSGSSGISEIKKEASCLKKKNFQEIIIVKTPYLAKRRLSKVPLFVKNILTNIYAVF